MTKSCKNKPESKLFTSEIVDNIWFSLVIVI